MKREMMREIVLDTETTGLDPKDGHRVVEIGAIELLNHLPTGNVLQLYINPKRSMPSEAFEVHGISEEFLADKPIFAKIAQEFVDFVGDAKLVIHNASFDVRFLNAELKALDRDPIEMSQTIDTVAMARKKFPGAPASLDALCRRFGIDLSKREKHGALLDCELLAEVYLELTGGRQQGFGLDSVSESNNGGPELTSIQPTGANERQHREPRPHQASAVELAAHQDFVGGLDDPIWQR
jgi:DNA polymerase-3 subunit epsilon